MAVITVVIESGFVSPAVFVVQFNMMSNAPFPGLAPCLEGETWQAFHDTVVGYHRLLNYNQAPPPPLDAETAAWVERTQRAARGQSPP